MIFQPLNWFILATLTESESIRRQVWFPISNLVQLALLTKLNKQRTWNPPKIQLLWKMTFQVFFFCTQFFFVIFTFPGVWFSALFFLRYARYAISQRYEAIWKKIFTVDSFQFSWNIRSRVSQESFHGFELDSQFKAIETLPVLFENPDLTS